MAQILAQLPGTFYVRPSPEALPYKNPGDPVLVGDTLGLIEVMKTFIEIKAEFGGTFSAYAVGDAVPVSPGQPLAEVV